MMITSAPGDMLKQDYQKWLKNILIFSTPSLLLFLTAIQNGVEPKDAAIALYASLINALIDLIKKWLGQNQYQVKE